MTINYIKLEGNLYVASFTSFTSEYWDLHLDIRGYHLLLHQFVNHLKAVNVFYYLLSTPLDQDPKKTDAEIWTAVLWN